MNAMNRSTVLRTLLVIAAAAVPAMAGEKLPSFPGAEGYGAIATGGRGGKVIHVTTLKAKGPGSLAEALVTKGPRIVVFDVSGVIRANVTIDPGDCTIAGQTAPGAGITLEGMLKTRYRKGANNIIIRFLRVRPRNQRGHTGDCVQMPQSHRVILDHCSFSWSVDEEVGCIGSADWTVQWCTFEEADIVGHDKGRPHNYGFCSAYAGSGRLSIHHNLFAHLLRRAPCVAPYLENAPADVRNNVIYNVNRAMTHSGHGSKTKSPINIIGNWYRHGPSAGKLYAFVTASEPEYYIAGNYVHGIGYIPDPVTPGAKFPAWFRTNPRGRRLKKAAKVAPVTTQKAEEAYKLVMAGGGCFPRDRVTTRTFKEVKTGKGKWGRNAPAAPTDEWFLKGMTVGKAPVDTDRDGMPDAWEKAHKLDPADPADRNKIVPKGASKNDRHAGYTWVEFYLNELADKIVGGDAL
jgi:pectate lyase